MKMLNFLVCLSSFMILFISIGNMSTKTSNIELIVDGLDNLYEGNNIVFRIILWHNGTKEDIFYINRIIVTKNGTHIDIRNPNRDLIGISDYIDDSNLDEKEEIEVKR